MYTPDDFDSHSCLKPNLGLYITLFFLMKDVVIILIEALSKLKAKGGPNHLSYFDDLVQPEMLLVNLLGLLVFVSLMKRDPSEAGLWKKISSNGRKIILVALMLSLGILVLEQYLFINEAYRWERGISIPLMSLIFFNIFFYNLCF